MLITLFAAPYGSAHAQSNAAPQDLRARVRVCASLPDGAARLQCYDQLGAEVEQTPADAWAVTLDRERVETLQREAFGFNMPNLSRLIPDLGGNSDDVESVDMQVARVIDHGNGRFSFVMENGQRWTQTEPQRTFNVRAGDTVSIRRGALTSYILNSSRGGPPHRVRRES
ncbi:MAG TPA: hypothetical protein VM915_06745 [Verrucomicrobiae bacterium]|nr:hypothetical protein [Verrucomicrobiae bacterium]